MKSHSTILFSVLLAITALTTNALAQFEELTKLVPPDANILVLVNHEDIMASPLAKTNQWAKSYEAGFAAGTISVPPGVEDHILAGSYDLELGTRNWEIALIKDKDGVMTPSRVARMFDGKVETVAGRPAVVIPGDTYIVQFGDTVAGGISPSNRQQTSRWIRMAKNEQEVISDYLKTAEKYSNKYGTDVVMAIDLQDAIPDYEVKNLSAISDKPDELAALLGNIKGVTLGINVTDKIKGKILVDFSGDASGFSTDGKKLVIKALAEFGMMVDDVNNWKPSVSGNRFSLEGDLGQKSFRRLMTVVQPSGFSNSGYASHSTAEEMSPEAKNIRYLKTIISLQADFHDNERNAVFLHRAWLDKTIEKIESLSVVDVDDQLVSFSQTLSDSYRDVLEIISNERAQEKIGKAKVQGYGYGYAYRYRGGRYGRNTLSSQRRSIEVKDRAASANLVETKLNEINKFVRDFKTEMSRKYKQDF